MNIAFLTPSVSRASGGIFEIERRLGQSLHAMPETRVSIFGLQDEHTEADLASWAPLVPRTFLVKGARGFGYAPGISKALESASVDVAHLHALWMFPSVVISNWSRRTNRPYIVTSNGMLEPWALRHSAWKKRIASFLYERRMLNGAACLQANTEKEAADFRAFGLKNPIAIIPNGIDLPVEDYAITRQRDNGAEVSGQWSVVSGLKSEGRKVLLYLGRIHPKKGLVNLLKAWKSVVSDQASRGLASGWTLMLAGWDQGGHEADLKQLATELNLPWTDVRDQKSVVRGPWSVVFLGPQFGDAKAACYAACDAFILPSFSEGLPMVVLEAWAYAKPVIMTPECNLREGFAAGAAIRIETNPESIAEGLRALLIAPCSTLHAFGTSGHALVASRFTWPKIAAEMRSVYEWVLGAGPRPNCVQSI